MWPATDCEEMYAHLCLHRYNASLVKLAQPSVILLSKIKVNI